MFSTCTTTISQSLARRSSVHSASDSLIFRDCIYSYKGQTSSTAISPQNFLWSCVTSSNPEVISLSLFWTLAYQTWQIQGSVPEKFLSFLKRSGGHKLTHKHTSTETHADARFHRCTHSFLALHCCFQQGPLKVFSLTCCDDDVNGKRKVFHLWN